MEGLGIAASLIAVIQLSGQVTSLSYGYISKVGQAQKEIKNFVDELNSLDKFLKLIDNYVKNGSANSDALQALAGPLRACTDQLENLESKLRPKKPPSWIRKKMRLTSLSWPFKEKEVLEIIIKIERNKTSFLLALSLDNISQLQANLLAQSSWRQADDSAREEEIRKRALHWLYPEDFDKIHTEIGSSRQKDTGGWLLESPSFKKLVKAEQGSRLLWGYGIPGAGKTFLSFAVADHFLSQARQKGYGVAYFYFNYKEKEQQRPATVLSCLLKQLASQLARLPNEISELYKLEKENKRPTFAQLVDALLATFKLFGQVFLVFDALDECDEESQRRELLPLFHKFADTGASLFVTSRQYPEDIQESFKEVSKIELSAKSDDIKNYIEERIERNPRAKRLVYEGKLKDSIISQLTECAKGMFLAVRFHVQYLCHQTTLNQIRAALETLKNHVVGEKLLDPTYDRVTEAIQNQPKSCADLAVRVLSWLVHAKRVLTVKEIQIAVSIEPGRYELEDSDLPDIKTLIDVCFGLVTVDENSDTVRLSHLTVHEYLQRHPIIPKDANLDIAIACTTYNSFNILSELAPHEFLGKQSLWETRLALYPFIKYSAMFMSSHLSSCKEESTQNTVLQFLTRSANLNFWVLCIYCFEQSERYHENYYVFSGGGGAIPDAWPFSEYYSEVWAPLEGASRIGHCLLVQRLVREGCTSPISVRLAISEGHESVARFLVENGANFSTPDRSGDLPLHLAARNGLEEVMKVLLDWGVDTKTKGIYGKTALHYAAEYGREAVVKLLLDRGADTEAKGISQKTALHHAAEGGHEAAVKLLLDRGADTEAKDDSGNTALHYAAVGEHEAVVKLLLDRGADIGAKHDSGKTALHYAAEYGCETVVKLLLDRGADIGAKNDGGETALHHVARYGHEAVVKLLLDRGADIEAKDDYQKTALRHAVEGGHEAVVKLLLDRGADIGAKDNSGETSLHYAARYGHEAAVKLLRDRGANVGQKNEDLEELSIL